MTTSRAFWDAIAKAKRALTVVPPYSTLQDAIHRAMIVDPPEPPHDPPLQVCRTCYGADHCCPVCHGAGWWKG